MDFDDYEVIVLPDKKIDLFGVRVVPLDAGPAEKRDLGVSESRGDIIAFIDDDAFPHKNWLVNSIKYFDEGYAAVGGPQVTPSNDSFSQKVSGLVLSSKLVGGLRSRYEVSDSSFVVDDWPTVNFLVKKSVFNDVGGFDSTYYPGEDTKLCLDIVNKDCKIIYAPDVIVYHHRRRGLLSHLKQIANYGFHRGYFVKKFPETSFKLQYFMPTFFLIFFFLGLFSFFNKFVFVSFLFIMLFYFFFSLIESIRVSKKIIYVFLFPIYVFLTHLVYGFFFVKGLLTKRVFR